MIFRKFFGGEMIFYQYKTKKKIILHHFGQNLYVKVGKENNFELYDYSIRFGSCYFTLSGYRKWSLTDYELIILDIVTSK